MGFKFLSLQSAIPLCFHLTGVPCKANDHVDDEDDDHHHHRSQRRKSRAIRVIGSDCRVRVYDKPVSVADLLRENPFHLVCRSDSFFIGQRVPTLSPAELLKRGHSYLLLPATFFHSDLSFLTLVSSLACPVITPLRPFDIKKTDSGSLQVRVSDEFLEKMVLKQEDDEKKKREVLRVCSTVELEKDYKQLVRCKSWKPKLETIKESSTESNYKRLAAGRVKIFSRIKRRKKKNKSKIKPPASAAVTASCTSTNPVD
ncbi:hypothetical protein IHE45_10G002500 [Dioscorea alata]|uniref:Uncharacterized protein n=1 Tax=Dioscorea alata TaxID=55571 RepID=A0ACB7V900_DIOAL|nr:hypothetical protein IHE45_10G002500 [Dioscorea alata]